MPSGSSSPWADVFQALAVGGVGDLARNAAAARRVGHQHAIAAGQRQIGGERRALVAAFFLDHLHQDDLAALDDFLNFVMRGRTRGVRSRASSMRVGAADGFVALPLRGASSPLPFSAGAVSVVRGFRCVSAPYRRASARVARLRQWSRRRRSVHAIAGSRRHASLAVSARRVRAPASSCALVRVREVVVPSVRAMPRHVRRGISVAVSWPRPVSPAARSAALGAARRAAAALRRRPASLLHHIAVARAIVAALTMAVSPAACRPPER